MGKDERVRPIKKHISSIFKNILNLHFARMIIKRQLLLHTDTDQRKEKNRHRLSKGREKRARKSGKSQAH